MNAAWTARVPWLVAGVPLGLAAASMMLLVLNRSTLEPIDGTPLWLSVLTSVVGTMAAVVVMAVLGALIATRQPANRMAWVFSCTAAALALALFTQEYAVRGSVTAPGSLPAVSLMAWLQLWTMDLLWPLAVVVLLAWFPDGRLPSRRWRPVLWMGVAAAALRVLLSLHEAWPLGTELRAVPLSVTMPPELWPLGVAIYRTVGPLGTWAAPLAVVAAAGALVGRLRGAHGEQRQQLKWFSYAGVLSAVTLVPAWVVMTFDRSDLPPLVAAISTYAGVVAVLVSAVGLPVAAGVAVLKHRLYDIDVVINKTVLFAGLAGFISVVYVAIVVGIGNLVGSSGDSDLGLSVVATAVVAVAFQPVKERLQRLANRLVYGQRATPYEVLSRFAQRVAGAYALPDVLPRMARVAAEATGATRARVWLRLGPHLQPAASWPEAASDCPSLSVTGHELPPLPDSDRGYPVVHRGELLGALAVSKAPGERITPAEDTLLGNLAAEAGLVLANVQLIGELKASQRRIVAAQDAERQRVERNLHDGAQQRLLAVLLRLRTAQSQLPAPASPPLGTILAEASDQLLQALAELRDLARGIHPTILTEQGLGPALVSLAERSPIPATVTGAPQERLPGPVESTAYYVVSEALANAAKHAHASQVTITAGETDGHLTVQIVDDGVGGADLAGGSGLRGLADRVGAVDGHLEVDSPPGGGTRITAQLPCA